MPLLDIRYDLPLALNNTAPAGPFTFTVSAAHQAGSGSRAGITGLGLEMSPDDGATWGPARVTRDGDRWKVTVAHPGTGFVWLRTRAADTEGNTVVETLRRAFSAA